MIFYLSEVGNTFKNNIFMLNLNMNILQTLFLVPPRTLGTGWASSLQWDSQKKPEICLQIWESVIELLPAWNGHSIKLNWVNDVLSKGEPEPWQEQCLVKPSPREGDWRQSRPCPPSCSLPAFSWEFVSYLFVQSTVYSHEQASSV